MVWDYSKDEVTVEFDPTALSSERVIDVISSAGFRASRVSTREEPTTMVPRRPWKAPLPDGAAAHVREAFVRARQSGKPVVMEFRAKWCAPCVRLKRETLEAPEVRKLLDGVELVFVDLDEHPSLARAYGVTSVPDVIFVDRRGMVVDRLKDFEAPAEFRVRLRRLLGARVEAF